MKEFFTDPGTGKGLCRENNGIIKQITHKDKEIIEELLKRSENSYPEQYKALCQEYARTSANKLFYDFLRARRIVNCCFGEHDCKPDIDQVGIYNFEMFKCPMVAECKYYKIICQPTYNSNLTEAELEVMKLIYEHVHQPDQIAERTFRSIHTVNNHRRNALQRLKRHSTEEFIGYAHKNNLFKD